MSRGDWRLRCSASSANERSGPALLLVLPAALSGWGGADGAASGTRGGRRKGEGVGACAGEACAWLSSGAASVVAAAGAGVVAGALAAAAAALREDLFLRVISAGGQGASRGREFRRESRARTARVLVAWQPVVLLASALIEVLSAPADSAHRPSPTSAGQRPLQRPEWAHQTLGVLRMTE